MEVHALFDGLAWLTAALAAFALRRWVGAAFPSAGRPSPAYLVAVAIGATLGAYGLGSLNLWLAGKTGFARSIEGALAGAIVAVELYKRASGLSGRTAALFALPVALGIAVGRVGCYLGGIEDFTYGTPTSLPWGHDFGDGILRHPVQLYESFAMLGFAALYGLALRRRDEWTLRNGFALLVLFYGAQRFFWEYLKPYPAVVGGLTVFQVVCLGLVVYALVMLWGENRHAQRLRSARP